MANTQPPDRTDMFFRLALLFVTIPLIELALLVWVGARIGFWPTMALVILTGLAGAALARFAGVQVVTRIQREVTAGRMPVNDMLDGLLVLVGGVVLLTPGLLTDIFGFALLVPWTRRIARGALQKRLQRMVAARTIRVAGFGFPGAGGVPHDVHGGGRDSPGSGRSSPGGRDVSGYGGAADSGADAGGPGDASGGRREANGEGDASGGGRDVSGR
jgi:UPF0716 protein FxsA